MLLIILLNIKLQNYVFLKSRPDAQRYAFAHGKMSVGSNFILFVTSQFCNATAPICIYICIP